MGEGGGGLVNEVSLCECLDTVLFLHTYVPNMQNYLCEATDHLSLVNFMISRGVK